MACCREETGEESYLIPVGGSNALGVYGYLEGFNELITQVCTSSEQNRAEQTSIIFPLPYILRPYLCDEFCHFLEIYYWLNAVNAICISTIIYISFVIVTT